MARPEAIQKAGYYPLADEVAKIIGSKIPVPVEGHKFVVLDPCAGEGVALKLICDSLKERKATVLPRGVELSGERFAKMVELFGTTAGFASGGAEFLEMTNQSVNILYLNPPFDDNGVEQERWLKMTLPFIAPGGLLFFVTTERSIQRWQTKSILNESYISKGVFNFPAEYRPYNEVLYVGVRRDQQRRGWVPDNEQIRYDSKTAPVLSNDTPDFPVVPQVDTPKVFGVTVQNLEGAIRMLPVSGVSTLRAWKELTRPQALASRFRPLRQLGNGHIANMIAAGAFRGLALQDESGSRCLISGYGSRINTPPETETLPDGSKRTITHQTPVIHLTVFDLDRNKLIEYSSQEPESLQRFILSNLALLRDSIHKNYPELFDPETMIAPYLEAASFFASPGLLPGATRARLVDGRKVRLISKDANARTWKADPGDGSEIEIPMDDVDHIYYKMLPAQVIEAAAMAWRLEHGSTGVLEVGQMGTGKTSTSLMAMFLARLHKYGLMIDKDAKGQTIVVGSDGKPAKISRQRNTIVIMCPGHLADKWEREIKACFKNFKFPGGEVKTVVPGKKPRRLIHCDIVDAKHVRCHKCGKKQQVLSTKDEKAGVSIKEKLENSKQRIACECGSWLVELSSTPMQDIKEAFAFHGLSFVILPKDKSKLGAEWRGIQGNLHRIGTKSQGVVLTEDRVRCPECGEFVKYIDDDGFEEFLTPDMLAEAQKTRTKYYCRAIVKRPVKDEDGNTITETHYVLNGKSIEKHEYDALPDGDKVLVKRFSQPVLAEKDKKSGTINRCGTPLFVFSALSGGEGKRRTELTHFLARQARHKYDFIADEVHQYKGASTQGAAMQVLTENANYSIGLTGTPYGGKASSVFYMLYRLIPGFKEVYDHGDLTAFVDRYGVKDTITTIPKDGDDDVSAYGAIKRGKGSTRRQEGNGCLPNIIEMFLPYSTFLTLKALHITLPPREEHFHWLPLDMELREGADNLAKQRKVAAMKARMGAPSRMSVWMNASLFWSLAPNHDVRYLSPESKSVIDQLRKAGKKEEADAAELSLSELWASGVEFNDDYPETSMTRQVADMCEAAWNDGKDRSIIYVASQKYYGAEHVYNACKRRGLKPFILTTGQDENVAKFATKGTYSKADLEDREEVIREAVEKDGINVLIVNPAIVAEGVDLVQFSRLHVLGLPNWSLYKFAQSLARLHRPGQERKVIINFWAYGSNPSKARGNASELQAMAVGAMSNKMRAADVVTGDVGSSLAALNENAGDIMAELRNRLIHDKMPDIDDIEDTATFSGETEAMTPMEIAIRDIIEQYEDHRIYGEPLPDLVLPSERKIEIKVVEPAAPTADDILEALNDFAIDVETKEDILPEPEAQPERTLEEWLNLAWMTGADDIIHNKEYDDSWIDAEVPSLWRPDVRMRYWDAFNEGETKRREIEQEQQPEPEVVQTTDYTLVLEQAYYVGYGDGNGDRGYLADEFLRTLDRDNVAYPASIVDKYHDGWVAGSAKANEVQPIAEPEPTIAEIDQAIEEYKQYADHDSWVQEIEQEPEPEDIFGDILAISDDDIDWTPAVVYDDTNFANRELPVPGGRALEF